MLYKLRACWTLHGPSASIELLIYYFRSKRTIECCLWNSIRRMKIFFVTLHPHSLLFPCSYVKSSPGCNRQVLRRPAANCRSARLRRRRQRSASRKSRHSHAYRGDRGRQLGHRSAGGAGECRPAGRASRTVLGKHAPVDRQALRTNALAARAQPCALQLASAAGRSSAPGQQCPTLCRAGLEKVASIFLRSWPVSWFSDQGKANVRRTCRSGAASNRNQAPAHSGRPENLPANWRGHRRRGQSIEEGSRRRSRYIYHWRGTALDLRAGG